MKGITDDKGGAPATTGNRRQRRGTTDGKGEPPIMMGIATTKENHQRPRESPTTAKGNH